MYIKLSLTIDSNNFDYNNIINNDNKMNKILEYYQLKSPLNDQDLNKIL